jgi:hypothetical protein
MVPKHRSLYDPHLYNEIGPHVASDANAQLFHLIEGGCLECELYVSLIFYMSPERRET